MPAKKTGTASARRVSAPWVTKAVLERRTSSGQFIKYAEEIARDKGKAERVAQKAGVTTGAGRLTKHYKK